MSASILRENLFDFFSARVSGVAERQDVGLSGQVVRYLATLLVRLGKTEQLITQREVTTLAELHMQATESPRPQAIRIYRELGDYALCVAGYFSESLNRKPVGPEYYAAMGGAAYGRVAGLTRSPRGEEAVWADLFDELSVGFRTCLGVLSELADEDRADSTESVVRLYERWLVTRDPSTWQRLAELGVLATTPVQE